MTLQELLDQLKDFESLSYWDEIKDIPITEDVEGFQKSPSICLHTTEYLGNPRIVLVPNKGK